MVVDGEPGFGRIAVRFGMFRETVGALPTDNSALLYLNHFNRLKRYGSSQSERKKKLQTTVEGGS